LSVFQKGQIVVVRLAGRSVTQTATVLGVSRAAVSKVMMTHTKHRNTSSAKRNSGQKSKLSERDRRTLKRIVSKSHRTTAVKVTAELNIHVVDPVSTKTVRRELYKSNFHGRAAITKPLITENSAKRRKR
jgi:transposase